MAASVVVQNASSPENDELRRKKKEFNRFIHRAKEEEEAGQFDVALKSYNAALSVMPSHEKLPSKIAKLTKKVAYLKTLTVVDEQWRCDEMKAEMILDAGMSTPYRMKKEIFDKLFPHQRVGVAWMWSLFKKSSGGILGDDMGLGKTIQVSSFLHGLFESNLIDRVLLILPLSLMSNWESELAKWCPRKRVRQFHGLAAAREKALAEVLDKSGIVLTTYETAQSAFKSLSMEGDEVIKWDVIVLDEGHKIKDPTKKTSKAIATFQANSKFILSGTPILNNLKELWALLNYTCDGQLLGDMKVFKKEFEEPIVRGQMKDASEYEKRKGFAVTNKLRALIEPHFIRRLKSDIMTKPSESHLPKSDPSKSSNENCQNLSSHSDGVISPTDTPSPSLNTSGNTLGKASHVDLADELAISLGGLEIRSPSKMLSTAKPEKASKMGLNVKKNDFVCWIPIEPLQLAIYTQFLISQRDRINEAIATTGQALPAIRMLRQITNHPRLLKHDSEKDTLAFPGFNLPQLSRSPVAEQSGKVKFLLDLLTKLKREGHRVLIFSQSVKMLDLIEVALDETKTGWKRLRMDGSINKVAERKALVDEYNSNNEIFLFLMTTQVGGVGITLTSADRVVIFDPAWNTAMDDQAADRVYRIGQKRNVVIYRLISSGTIEEKMYRKQVFKGALSKSLLGKEASVHTYFTRGELRELFTFDPDDVKEAQTQLLLASMHSHKRDSYPALEAEIDFLNTLPTIVGISDHNLLYTEETTAVEQNFETAQAAAQAHELISKTIVPKDVIQLEQAETSARMASRTGAKGPITTIYVDGETPGRPRRDPSQIGTRVGDLTLLSVDDQFELGLAKMSVTQAKLRKNPFTVKEKPRSGNFGGNDRVQSIPVVSKKSHTSPSSMVPAKKQSTQPSSKSPVSLPIVKKSAPISPVDKNSSVSARPTTPVSQPQKEPATVVIKKSGAIPPSKPSVMPTAPVALAVEDEIAQLLGNVSLEHSVRREIHENEAKLPVAASSGTSGASERPSEKPINVSGTGIKPKSRRVIEEDDEEVSGVSPIVAPAKLVIMEKESLVVDIERNSPSEEKVEAVEDFDPNFAVDTEEATEQEANRAEDQEVEEECAEIEEREVMEVVRVPKMSRKSIVSFDLSPSDEKEVIVVDDVVEDERNEEEEEEEEGESDGCSEASESEMSILEAEARGERDGSWRKHFVEQSGYSTEEEERSAETLGSETDGSENESGSQHNDSFVVDDDEEEEIVDFDEKEALIGKLLSEKCASDKRVVVASNEGPGVSSLVCQVVSGASEEEVNEPASEFPPKMGLCPGPEVAPHNAPRTLPAMYGRSKRLIEESDDEEAI